MPGNAIVDRAIVEALHTLLEGTRAVHIVGVLSDARAPSAGFSTMPWKTEAEWGEEVRRRPDGVVDVVRRLEETAADAVRRLEETASRPESLRLDLVRSDEELLRIKSSLTWRAVVKYRPLPERLLPPSGGGRRLYERVRSTIRRLAVGND